MKAQPALQSRIPTCASQHVVTNLPQKRLARIWCLRHLCGYLVVLLFLVAPSLATAQPPLPLEWNPGNIELSVPRGGTQLLNVRLTANSDINDLSFFVVPEISGFVSVEAARLTSAIAGQSYDLLLRIGVPSSTPVGLYEGTVHVRDGPRTVPAVLQITLEVIDAPGNLNSLVLASDSGGLPDPVRFVIQGDIGSSFRAEWTLESSPLGSNVQLPLETDMLAIEFDPDVLGAYAVSVRVTDGTDTVALQSLATVADTFSQRDFDPTQIEVNEFGVGTIINQFFVPVADSLRDERAFASVMEGACPEARALGFITALNAWLIELVEVSQLEFCASGLESVAAIDKLISRPYYAFDANVVDQIYPVDGSEACEHFPDMPNKGEACFSDRGPNWHLELIGAPEAWSETAGSQDVILGISDSGYLVNHQDYDRNRLSRVVKLSRDDIDRHGTQVAGTAGAVFSGNKKGTAGINWNSLFILELNSFFDSFFGLTRIINDYRAEKANNPSVHLVVNISWSLAGYIPKNFEPTGIESRLRFTFAKSMTAPFRALAATNPDVLWVLSAGNGVGNMDSKSGYYGVDSKFGNGAIHYDGFFDYRPLDNVIVVGAVENVSDTGPGFSLRIPYYSNFGESVDLAAPADFVAPSCAIFPTEQEPEPPCSERFTAQFEEHFEGTSAAAPIVAGAASLLWSADGNLQATDIKSLLLRSAAPGVFERNDGDWSRPSLWIPLFPPDKGDLDITEAGNSPIPVLDLGCAMAELTPPPTAEAGIDQVILVGATVQLDGSVSSDVAGRSLEFEWKLKKPGGQETTLSGLSPTFVADSAGTYFAELTVRSRCRTSIPDSVTVVAKVAVPDVVGLTQVDAEADILAEDLKVGTVTRQNDDMVPIDHVIDQDPAAGTPVDAETAVDLIVSSGPVVVPPVLVPVPNVVGLFQADAEAAIEAAGLEVARPVTFQNSDTVPIDHVIDQDPDPDIPVALGTAVDLIVSSGPATPPVLVSVPDVDGLLQVDAEEAILSAGLVIGTVTTQNDDTVPVDRVITHFPQGIEVPLGSAVDLTVSLGPVVTPPVGTVTPIPMLSGGIKHFAVEADGTTALVTEGSGNVSRVGLGGGALPKGHVQTIARTDRSIGPIAIEAGGQTALAVVVVAPEVNESGLARFDLTTGHMELLVDGGLRDVRDLVIEPGGASVLITQTESVFSGLYRITLATGAVQKISSIGGFQFALEPGGESVLVATGVRGNAGQTTRDILRVDLASGLALNRWGFSGTPMGIAIEPGGTTALVTTSQGSSTSPESEIYRINLLDDSQPATLLTACIRCGTAFIVVESSGATALILENQSLTRFHRTTFDKETVARSVNPKGLILFKDGSAVYTPSDPTESVLGALASVNLTTGEVQQIVGGPFGSANPTGGIAIDEAADTLFMTGLDFFSGDPVILEVDLVSRTTGAVSRWDWRTEGMIQSGIVFESATNTALVPVFLDGLTNDGILRVDLASGARTVVSNQVEDSVTLVSEVEGESILVVEQRNGGSLSRVDLGTGAVTELANGLGSFNPGQLPPHLYGGLALEPDGQNALVLTVTELKRVNLTTGVATSLAPFLCRGGLRGPISVVIESVNTALISHPICGVHRVQVN